MATTKEKGNAGVRRASTMLTTALCAETTNSSMDEDAAKVDLHLTFRNAFQQAELLTFRCQVKSGPSYATKYSNYIGLSIDLSTRAALSGVGTPGVVLWVPLAPEDRVYWHASDPRSKRRTSVKIPYEDYVRPSLRYDLSRLAIYATWHHKHSCQTVRKTADDKILEVAKQRYANLKACVITHPLVGELKVTRLAWRHITRRSKTTKQRHAALIATPYLHTFLDKVPDRYICRRQAPVKCGSAWIEKRQVTCWYRDALLVDGHRHTLVTRILETISYPVKWQSRPLTIDEVTQEATLISWWHTPQ